MLKINCIADYTFDRDRPWALTGTELKHRQDMGQFRYGTKYSRTCAAYTIYSFLLICDRPEGVTTDSEIRIFTLNYPTIYKTLL
ncbi:MAG: hypothetical protein F6J93_33040 [Oscillatoria sp. SIO1A7]|nr:hypothetical protein [Oscillatoria sp. SIO1A7]